jgi:hypothetical protein
MIRRWSEVIQKFDLLHGAVSFVPQLPLREYRPLPALGRPVRALLHALHERVLHPTLPAQDVELLRVVRRAAEPDLPHGEVVLQVRALVDRPRVRGQQRVVRVRARRRRRARAAGAQHESHRVREAARDRIRVRVGVGRVGAEAGRLLRRVGLALGVHRVLGGVARRVARAAILGRGRGRERRELAAPDVRLHKVRRGGEAAREVAARGRAARLRGVLELVQEPVRRRVARRAGDLPASSLHTNLDRGLRAD